MLPERYSIENIRRLLDNPRLAHREVFEIATTINGQVDRFMEAFETDYETIDVIAADWDNLLILDACRYDLFSTGTDRLDTDGHLERVYSKGGDSWEFMESNFAGRDLHDTVYVTANPHFEKLDDDTFHDIINLLDVRWNEEFNTVLPEAVVEEAEATLEKFPEKRLIIHFMQPHFPFLGPTGTTFHHAGIDKRLNGETGGEPNPWLDLIYSEGYEPDTIVKAYRENFEIVLPHVESLLDELAGKSVVTADHGNLIGERGFPVPIRMYGHPRGIRQKKLIEVPWYEAEYSTRRRTKAEPPLDTGERDQSIIDQRLRQLGYR